GHEPRRERRERLVGHGREQRRAGEDLARRSDGLGGPFRQVHPSHPSCCVLQFAMMIDLETLGLTEMIRLRERISENLVGRYERMLVVAQLQLAAPRDLVVPGGKVTPHARGALICFPSVDLAVAALVDLFRASAAPETMRAAVHWSPVFTDGELVAGDAVGLCA